MDDEILEFGSVNTQNFQSLQNISSVVQHSEGVSWKLCGVWPVTPELPGQELWPGCRLAASEGLWRWRGPSGLRWVWFKQAIKISVSSRMRTAAVRLG